jgi:surface protein
MKNLLFRSFLRVFVFLIMVFILNVQASVDSFIIKVQTNNSGASSNTKFTLPTSAGSTYNYNIDCDGGGSYDGINVKGDFTCEYSVAGSYTITIDGTFPHIYFNNSGDKEKILSVEQWGTGVWDSMEGAFYGASNLVVNDNKKPNLSHVTNMSLMFASAISFNSSIGDWNTSHVTDMSLMFKSATAFNQDINSWDTSNVTDMNSMFYQAFSFNQSLSHWDTSKVENMSHMFEYASIFNQNIENWNTANVKNMSYMFKSAQKFNQNIDNWDLSSIEDMDIMFYNALDFDQDVGNWSFENNTNVTYMFKYASSFNQDISHWDFSKLTFFATMFADGNVSTNNYDKLLNAFNSIVPPLENVDYYVSDSTTYCQAKIAHDNLTDNHSWTFHDGGLNCDYYIDSSSTVSIASGEKDVIVVSTHNISATSSTYTIEGGADKDKFNITSAGALSFITAPNSSNPTDYNGDNIYRVQVKSTDGTSVDIQTIEVEVTGTSIVPIITYLLF